MFKPDLTLLGLASAHSNRPRRVSLLQYTGHVTYTRSFGLANQDSFQITEYIGPLTWQTVKGGGAFLERQHTAAVWPWVFHDSQRPQKIWCGGISICQKFVNETNNPVNLRAQCSAWFAAGVGGGDGTTALNTCMVLDKAVDQQRRLSMHTSSSDARHTVVRNDGTR